jgi:hypothetical protein
MVIIVVSLFYANVFISQSFVESDGYVTKLCERARVKFKKFDAHLLPFLAPVNISSSVCSRETIGERISLF